MNDREFRLECLRLATGTVSMGMTGEDVVVVAEKYFNFVFNRPVEPEPEPEPSPEVRLAA